MAGDPEANNRPHGPDDPPHGADNSPPGADNGPHRADNGPHRADNGPHGRDNEYPVLSPEPALAKSTPAFYGPDPDELLERELKPQEEKQGFQFSLREMFAVLTVAAISLGLASSVPGGGPLRAALLAAGMVLFASLAVLDYLRAKRRVLYVVWWTLFVSYLLIGLLAAAGTF